MFFNLGMTADAAAAHRHELSTPSSASQSPLNTPPMSPTSHAAASSNPAIAFAAVLPSFNLPRPFNIPAPLQNVKEALGMPSNPASRRPSTSDDDFSAVHSDTTETKTIVSASGRRRRNKTSFRLAHPPRNPRHKRLRIRPKLLLQLQQVSQTPRPIPALDVLPSITFVPRLARRFPTMFRGRHGLGPNDLIIVNSDIYSGLGAEDDERSVSEEDESEDHREVIATICQLLTEDARQKGKVEICLRYGSPWEATPLPNGSYEFVTATKQGRRTVRWVLRGKSNRRVSAPVDMSSLENATDNRRFTFSVIDPNTRRHPVIASMTRSSIDVYHQYTIPSPSYDASMSPLSPTSVMSNDPAGTVFDTDDNLRTLIMITGIYVAFREGWSQDPLYNDLMAGISSGSLCSPIRPKHQATLDETEGSADKDTHRRSLNLMGNKMRHSSMRQSPSLPTAESSKSLASLNVPKRARSTGAAFMERANRRSASSASKRHTMFAGSPDRGSFSPALGSEQPPPSSSQASDRKENKVGTVNRSTVEPSVATVDERGSCCEPRVKLCGKTGNQTHQKSSDKHSRWRRLSNLFSSRRNTR
ncbi:hypothetical protein DTO164E3_3747 [Paecilomyces variotii]|nr:hypothetical protein DTO164E3_3747 [Paecilomyces variotii]KAJ9206143.1 hypothetical protein DTO032I3_2008 [Paecilomyces variotii]KAJ9270894.1 hypothetical protein DTO212C5_3119 [Paecilomyces variotii]KAJ9281654.1 hypothetical protein DTO021D3_1420 [Paecilomyces variotii]KAJ9291988.1 hypothetical protein DTO021C3_428 [Paecilomyces variotii]